MSNEARHDIEGSSVLISVQWNLNVLINAYSLNSLILRLEVCMGWI
jgi:hypothetical protein